jgi:hypothetical protein
MFRRFGKRTNRLRFCQRRSTFWIASGRAFELFEKRGGAPGNDVGDWLQAEKEVFRVPDMDLAESEECFRLGRTRASWPLPT